MEIIGKKWINGQWVETIDKVKKNRERLKGVYAIELASLKMVYVGQSVNIKSRWSQHRYVLNKNTCENKELQRYWNKYAKDFEFKIVELTDDLLLREKQIAESYISQGYTLFNNYFSAPKGENTSIIIRDEHKPTVIKLLRLIDKGRINLDHFNSYLDAV